MSSITKTNDTIKNKPHVKQPKTPKETFHYYWERIEKAEKAFHAAERQRARLLDTFNSTLLPLEHRLCQIHEAYIYKLLSFSNKKSLSFNLKLELLEWIQEEHSSLSRSPFLKCVDIAALNKAVASAIDALDEPSAQNQHATEEAREALRAEIDSFGFDSEGFSDSDLDTLLEAMIDSPHTFLAELMDMHERIHRNKGRDDAPDEKRQTKDDGDSDDDANSYFEDAFDFFAQEDLFETDRKELPKDILSKKSLNTFYKKIAQRIHPDKAENEEDRDKRNAVMQVLTEAKKEKDAFTIFSLYQEYVSNDEFNFSNEEFTALIDLLRNKLHLVKDRKRELKLDNSVDAIVYERFHARTKRETNEKMVSHQTHLENCIQFMTRDIKDIKNLKTLKEKLQQRIQKEESDDLFSFFM